MARFHDYFQKCVPQKTFMLGVVGNRGGSRWGWMEEITDTLNIPSQAAKRGYYTKKSPSMQDVDGRDKRIFYINIYFT